MSRMMPSISTQLKSSCQSCSIAELCLPIGLSESEVEQLDEVVKKRRPLTKDDYVYRNGEDFRSIYAIRTGTIKTYILSEDGNEQITGFHLAGELIGLEGLGDDTHKCNAVVLEDTSLCEIPFNQLDEFVDAVPAMRSKLIKLLSKEIVSEQNHLLLISQKNAEERLATFLVDLSKRLRTRGKDSVTINLAMAKSDIANYLSVANETLSRMLNKFQSQGIIQVSGRVIEVLDSEKLCELSGT